MGGQVVVGILEVPQVIGDDEQPGHVRPEHVVVLFGRVDAPPARHAEDVQDTGDAVYPVPPAAVQPNVLAGEPPAVSGLSQGHCAADAGFKIAAHGDEDIDGDDDERKNLEPLRLSYAPFILQHHKPDAARGGGVQLGVVEPAVHMRVGGVVQRPLRAHGRARVNGDKIYRQCGGKRQEEEDTALFGAAGQFVGRDEAHKDESPAQKLEAGVFAVDLK